MSGEVPDHGLAPAGSAAPDRSRRQWRWGLLAAYALHLVVLSLYVFSVIPQQFHPPEHLFWLHNGGDNVGYYDLAHDLLAGDLRPSKYPLGFPILLLPFVALFPGYDQPGLLQVVAAFWSLVMFPVGQWTLAWLAERLTGQRRLALLTVLLWTLLPLIFYAGLRLVSSPEVAETGSVHLTWAQMLSDGPAALFTLLLVAAFLRLREEPGRAWWPVALGALGGFLTLIRLTGGLAVGVVGLMLLLERRWRAAAVMAVVAVVVFAPQMIYNQHFFGGPLTTGYQVLDELPPEGLFSLGYLGDAAGKAWARAGLGLAGAALLAVGVGWGGLRFLGRRDRVGALTVALWLLSYIALYSVYYHSWIGGLLRFWIPAYPAALILVAGLVGEVTAWWSRRATG